MDPRVESIRIWQASMVHARMDLITAMMHLLEEGEPLRRDSPVPFLLRIAQETRQLTEDIDAFGLLKWADLPMPMSWVLQFEETFYKITAEYGRYFEDKIREMMEALFARAGKERW